MSEKNDKLVMDLFKRVQDKKAEIEKVSRPQWETSCTIGYNPDSVQDRTNIQTVVDLKKLVELGAFLLTKEESWEKANKAIGVNVKFSWMGYTKDQWFADLRTRAAIVEINKKKKELEALETRLNGLVTVEQRREMELEKIAKELA